jgi:hypothetical protein
VSAKYAAISATRRQASRKQNVPNAGVVMA